MSEKETIETEAYEKTESTESAEKEYDEAKEKINEKVEKGKVFAEQAANDLGKYLDEFVESLKGVDGKINEYKKSVINTIDVDLIEDDDKFYLKVNVPGIKKDDVSIEATENSATITCEFPEFKEEIENLEDHNVILNSLKSGKSKKEIKFPSEIDTDNITAKYDNGVVFVTFPKIEVKKHKVNVE